MFFFWGGELGGWEDGCCSLSCLVLLGGNRDEEEELYVMSRVKLVILYMRCGAEAAVMMSEIVNIEGMNV